MSICVNFNPFHVSQETAARNIDSAWNVVEERDSCEAESVRIFKTTFLKVRRRCSVKVFSQMPILPLFWVQVP